MTDARRVRCEDCGNEWSSTAKNPRCAKAACGRSRNVVEVDGGEPLDEPDDAADGDDGPATADDAPDPDPPDDDDADGEPWRPAFESVEDTVDLPDDLPADDGPDPEPTDDVDDDVDDEGDTSDPVEAAADAVPEVDPETLAVAFDVSFGVAATRRGDHWALDDDEAETLGRAWAPVANEYLPALLAEHTALGVALLATASIVAPRMAVDRDLAEKAEAEERAERDGEPGEVREPSTVADDAVGWTAPDERDDETPAEAAGPNLGGYSAV